MFLNDSLPLHITDVAANTKQASLRTHPRLIRLQRIWNSAGMGAAISSSFVQPIPNEIASPFARFIHSGLSRLSGVGRKARNDKPIGSSAFVVIALLAFAQPAFAADVHLEMSTRKITVGDPIEMTLSMTPPPGSKVVWPSGEQLAPAEMIKMDTTDSKPGRAAARYTISLFETGKQTLPRLPVLLVSTTGTDTAWAEPGDIRVTSTSSERDTTLRDIRPPVRLPWTFKEMLPYLIGAFIALAAAALIYYLWRKAKLRRGEIPVYVPPPPPPDVTAMRKLEELRVKKLWQDGRVKEYHSELTEIIKEYIGARYDFNALEMTSEELLDARAQWAVDDDALSRIRRIVNIADFVKFAKFRPDPHDHEKCLELAFAHVEATRAKPLPLTESEGGSK